MIMALELAVSAQQSAKVFNVWCVCKGSCIPGTYKTRNPGNEFSWHLIFVRFNGSLLPYATFGYSCEFVCAFGASLANYLAEWTVVTKVARKNEAPILQPLPSYRELTCLGIFNQRVSYKVPHSSRIVGVTWHFILEALARSTLLLYAVSVKI
jgi:hypothetical protein